MKSSIYLPIFIVSALSIHGAISDEYCDSTSDQCPNEKIKILKNLLGEERVLESDCFKAAVFEYARYDLPSMYDSITANLAEYHVAADIAAQEGAKIIVYPEDGLFYGPSEKILQVLEEIPDPQQLNYTNNILCDHEPKYLRGSKVIMKELSCIAKTNNIYVVANFGTMQNCQPLQTIGTAICPESGQLPLNTDVVFDNEGRFISRYRKYNVYIEVFQRPPALETVYFDTSFGRFGIFTCFDMIFEKPALDLVEKYNVDTMIFPTYWYDELPILSAIQYQDAWSLRNKVNLLASNILKPELGTTGSGIYSTNDFIHTPSDTKKSTLLVASVAKKPKHQIGKTNSCSDYYAPKAIEMGPMTNMTYSHSHWKLTELDKIHVLEEVNESVEVCNNRVCCKIQYKLNSASQGKLSNRLILMVRDSQRPGRFNWYEQVCFLATLEKPYSEDLKRNMLKFNEDPIVGFSKLKLNAVSDSKYMYPIAAHSNNLLMNRNDRSYECQTLDTGKEECTLSLKQPSEENVYSFGLYGRLYSKDKTI